ncbi:unnamed protein product [Rangifer tarandus platyrhynchus]|uniref:Uncharacterized protein n=1 Tax=Rangifer tarandus platyrhynchus TaxID=3082113 RepID=A0AC59YIM1_RANTA
MEVTQLAGCSWDPKGPPALALSLGTHLNPPSLPAAPPGPLSQVLPGKRVGLQGAQDRCWLPLLQGRSRGPAQGPLAWGRGAVCPGGSEMGPAAATTPASSVVPACLPSSSPALAHLIPVNIFL